MSVYLELNKKNVERNGEFPKTPKLKMTYQYNLFENDITNRVTTGISDLIKSMKSYGYLPAYPIHVVHRNGKLVVKDGAHRLAAAKITKNPVFYVVLDDINISIPKINKPNRSWKLQDYVGSYVKQGLDEYIRLQEFSRRYKLPISAAAGVLMGYSPVGNSARNAIMDGTFRVCDIDTAANLMWIVTVVRSFFPQATGRYFLAALYRCFLVESFDYKRFCKKCKKHSHLFAQKATIDDYLSLIEQVYNEQARKNDRIPLKFLANQAAELKAPLLKNSRWQGRVPVTD